MSNVRKVKAEMTSFKPPTFQERAALAARARQAALDRLHNRVPINEAALAERQAARIARDAADAERREAKRMAREQEKAARAARAAERRELEEVVPILSDAEQKAARDARYSPRRRRSKRP